MANVTVYEFDRAPDEHEELGWPAVVTTTLTTAQTHNLRDASQYAVVCCDLDCRINFNGAAGPSSMPLLAALPNRFRLKAGTGRTLQFA